MVWYIPPLSPIQNAAEAGAIGMTDVDMPDVKSLRIPVRYLANMLTAGAEAPIVTALERMLAMRSYMREKSVNGVINAGIAERVGMTPELIEDMYYIMSIANYEDRFVIPTTHREHAEHAMDIRSGCGFTDGNGCSTGISEGSMFGGKKKKSEGDFVVPTVPSVSREIM
jgi:nitrate reductase beta subunit